MSDDWFAEISSKFKFSLEFVEFNKECFSYSLLMIFFKEFWGERDTFVD